MRKASYVLVLIMMVCQLCSARRSSLQWTKFQFLVGTWHAAGSGTPGQGAEVAIKFEIAPPDQPNNFKMYVEGTAQLK